MITLGLCVAHDAGIAVMEDGHVRALVSRERWTRRKRCALLTADFITETLDRLGLAWADVDRVAIASSQSWPYLFVDSSRFRFDYDPDAIDGFGVGEATRRGMLEGIKGHSLSVERAALKLAQFKEGQYGEYIADDLGHLTAERDVLWCREWSFMAKWWKSQPTGAEMATWCAAVPKLRGLHQGYLPVSVTLDGVRKPGLIVPHHLAHAAYSYYQSDTDDAAVMTADNGDTYTVTQGYLGGIYARGIGNRLIPVGPSYAVHGHAYQRTAEHLGLGSGGGAGKLMGLAPYGRPRFADRSLIGDAFAQFGEEYATETKSGSWDVVRPFLARVAARADRLYDDGEAIVADLAESAHGRADLKRLSVDTAASIQWAFEENALADTRKFADALTAGGQWCPTLILGGGAALNCPANSRIHDEGPFRSVLVPPAVDDSGLPLGAALALAHDVLDLPRETAGMDRSDSAFLGFAYGRDDLERALEGRRDAVVVDDTLDAAADAGRMVAGDRVIAWFEGRSEVGPRALGHRSIVCDPRQAANWRRVNEIKRREVWRPFAPAVLREKAAAWFDGGPTLSPHMLFTAQVKGDRLPAITHVDGSARVQTVGDDTGGFRRLIEAYEAETGVPVVMNTSFNGPGEPIVETPAQAVDFLLNTEIDAVYVDGVRLTSAAGRSTS